MDILINDVSISFQLEHERTAGDIIDGLDEWLSTTGHRIREIRLNGQTVDQTSAWRDREVAEVERLEILASSVHQLAIDQLETIINYTDLLRRVADEGSPEQLASVLEELPHVTAAVARLVPDIAGALEEPLQDTSPEKPEVRSALGRRAGEVAQILQQRQRELLDPEHELRQTVAALRSILPAFEEIPVQLQSGRERDALDMVARFAELTGRLLRVFPLAAPVRPELASAEVNGASLEQAMSTLTDLLRELESAMQNSDLVLVGDLMEYELLPQLTALTDAFGAILDTPRHT